MDESKILTVYSHLNDERNPHPRYQNFPTFISQQFPLVGGFKIFDSIVQMAPNALNSQDRTLSSISFTAVIQDLASDSSLVTKALLDVSFRPSQSTDDVRTAISCNPISFNSGVQFYAVLYWKKVSDTPSRNYQVQIYLYTTATYTQFRVTFIDFFTDLWHVYGTDGNAYQIDGRNDSEFKRIKYYLGDNITNNPQSTPDVSFTAVDSRNSATVIEDDLLGNGIKTRPLSANQGYQLDQRVTSNASVVTGKLDKTGGTLTGGLTITPSSGTSFFSTLISTLSSHFIWKKGGLKSWTMQQGTGGELNYYPSATADGVDWDTTKQIRFMTDGTVVAQNAQITAGVTAASFVENGVALSAKYASALVAVPATATSPGSVGQRAVDSSYYYVCVATNSWKRTALSAW